MELQFGLYRLKKELELRKGREYSWSEIGRRADLHRNTLERIATNDTARVDLETLKKLILFFRAEGMNVMPNDLIVVDDAPTDAAQ